MTNAATDNPPTVARSDPWTAEVKFQDVSPATASRRPSLNHGQYVKAQGGGKDAAQDCAGMPVNSAQGKK